MGSKKYKATTITYLIMQNMIESSIILLS